MSSIEKQIKFVTDGGSDVVSACQKLGYERDHCIAHVIHLVINDCVQNFTQLEEEISSYKKICKALFYSNDLFKELKTLEYQEKVGKLMLNFSELSKYKKPVSRLTQI